MWMSRAASHLQAAVMSAVAWISNLSSTVTPSRPPPSPPRQLMLKNQVKQRWREKKNQI